MYKSKEDQRAYQLAWKTARRQKYIALHGGKCIKCGSIENLEFDHVDRTTKVSHRIWSWRESRIVAELDKCQLLCKPCHIGKTIEESSYPERQHGTNLMYTNGKCRCQLCRDAHAQVNALYR